MTKFTFDSSRGVVLEQKTQVKVLVTGGRDYADKETLDQILDRLNLLYGFTDLCHGAAEGADSLAGEWAISRDIRVMRFPANWKKYGNEAGPRRNQFMYDTFKPDLVVAFPGGNGTKNMIEYAMLKNCEVFYANGSQ